ncbi:MAG: DUF429 domain-containing protein [Zestosphaera sp.]
MKPNDPSASYAVGLDLAAKSGRCSGAAVIDVLRGEVASLRCLSNDEDIITFLRGFRGSVVAIDAPLTAQPRMRDVDRLMYKSGLRVLPPSFRWMKQLTLRGYELTVRLNDLGYTVIETHPRSVLKYVGVEDFRELLMLLGIKLDEPLLLNVHLKDALTAAAVAYCYVTGCTASVGSHDGVIYLVKRLR